MSYLRQIFTRGTPQSQPIPGSDQVANSAGGYAWPVDDFTRLQRFLILGSEGGSYYATERALTAENAQAVRRCIEADGPRAVETIVALSESGRAPKNDPALFALAMAAAFGDLETRRAALANLPRVARTGTHLLHFAQYVQQFRGWGRALRRAVGDWYQARPLEEVALQVAKYAQRDGWSQADLLRLAHPRAADPARDRLYRYVVDGYDAAYGDGTVAAPRVIEGAQRLASTTEPGAAARLILDQRLPREVVPTQFLAEPVVWEALLADMPLTALIRNLATLTRIGLLAEDGGYTRSVVAQLADAGRLRAARVHPIQLLSALCTYAAGRGLRGRNTWEPVPAIRAALDAAFYLAFGNVEPTGKRTLLALDVSGSMSGGMVAGVPGLTPRLAAAAMALVTAAREPRHHIMAFSDRFMPLDIQAGQRLDEVIQRTSGLPFRGTDCALPMRWALERRVPVDTFVVYTDSETWYGDIHPAEALRAYRERLDLPAKLVVVGLVANSFTIADPDDAGMLDVVGFDSAAPALISDFSAA
ncbi:MAG TPA: TROVE domain-containing protein [Thermomicrobiaceae bacterium]|nr:TROVE domain-containing protein [Thermomicrobiaceae bacterium]